MAPIEFIGRYMPGWFDYAICDEIHQLAGDTAQGNALGTLASCTDRIVGLTGTLLGGYADDLFNTLFRLEAARMKEHGYEWGTTGRSSFTQDYGVLETITKIEPAENRCSKAKTTSMVRRKPGASPLLFGEFLMQLCAFVFLEDISGELPPYEESYVSVPMDPLMMAAYRELEDAIRKTLKEHRGNRSVLSTMLNTLLLYPDHPYGLGTLYGTEFDPELKRNVRFVIAETRDLPEEQLYSKERRLIEEIRKELAEGRRCQVFAVYTQKHDVTARLHRILKMREFARQCCARAWTPRNVKPGMHGRSRKECRWSSRIRSWWKLVWICWISRPSFSMSRDIRLHTLRQASRRSWRIGQRRPVRVKFLCYEGTMQTACLRLMGKKLLVALTMEGKFAGEGLQNIDEDDDMLSAMARELVERNGIGETADAVWKALNNVHQSFFPTKADCDGCASSEGSRAVLESQAGIADLVEVAVESNSVLIFGRRPNTMSPRRPRAKTPVPEQASLFG